MAQETEVLGKVKAALQSGNSQMLQNCFAKQVTINIGEEKGMYKKQETVDVFAGFFSKYPPVKFEFVHQGDKKDNDLKYSIGQYTHKNGIMVVYMLVGKEGKGEVVSLMDFGHHE
ncbi:DUF4783 domain-containing protein [Limibacter armeniacum]|uniref:DUF4783 domain-containing protein n=1 Tax=Limibacter armeniacum TaxID=466084 RepID=UPI002FE54BFE